MKPDSSLCRHLAEDPLAELTIGPDDMLDWHDGPVAGVVRCAVCPGAALAVLVDWSRSRRVRVFALGAIDSSAVVLFRRNTERGSCDLGRQALEREALFASAGPVERLVAVDLDRGDVLAMRSLTGREGLPDEPWQERMSTIGDGSGFAQLGLSPSDVSAG